MMASEGDSCSRRLSAGLFVLALVVALASTSTQGGSQHAAKDWIQKDSARLAKVGGPFSLVDHAGKNITDKGLRGTYLLVYFGYTLCPDLYPTGLQVIGHTMDLLAAKASKVQPIFITIDPERDRADDLAEYVTEFHPRLIGLSGTAEQIRQAADGYRVRYGKLFYPWSDDEKNPEYAIYRTTDAFLVGPEGHGLAVFPRGIGPEDMAREIRDQIEAQR